MSGITDQQFGIDPAPVQARWVAKDFQPFQNALNSGITGLSGSSVIEIYQN
jgi:hypothetical protein